MATHKVYYKNGVEVTKPTSVVHDGCTYLSPTDKMLVSFGYEIREEEVVSDSPKTSYEDLVVIYIREKYSIDDEIAILRQRDSKPEEFAEYNAYCEECKTQAKNTLK
jgi:hypothetical protein